MTREDCPKCRPTSSPAEPGGGAEIRPRDRLLQLADTLAVKYGLEDQADELTDIAVEVCRASPTPAVVEGEGVWLELPTRTLLHDFSGDTTQTFISLGPIPGTDYAVVRESEVADLRTRLAQAERERDRLADELGAATREPHQLRLMTLTKRTECAEARAAKLEAAVGAFDEKEISALLDFVQAEIDENPDIALYSYLPAKIRALAALTPPQETK